VAVAWPIRAFATGRAGAAPHPTIHSISGCPQANFVGVTAGMLVCYQSGGVAMNFSKKWKTPFCCLFIVLWASASARGMTEDERNNIELYERLAPGVVNITSIVLEHDFFFNTIPRQGVGSGSIIDHRGYVLTNHHVIEDARKLEVTLANGKKYNASLIGSRHRHCRGQNRLSKRRAYSNSNGIFSKLEGRSESNRHREPFRSWSDAHHGSDQLGRPDPAGIKRSAG
jgi:hypothetical protein